MRNPQLAEQLIEMMKIDQELRLAAKPGKELINYLIYAIDGVHGERLRRIIDVHGYPTEAVVGADALHALWLVVQHQDFDVSLQEECLKNCNFDLADEAHLTDRVLVNRGRPQRFGTQWYRKDGKLMLRPIEDKKNIDKLRESHGLPKLKETLQA